MNDRPPRRPVDPQAPRADQALPADPARSGPRAGSQRLGRGLAALIGELDAPQRPAVAPVPTGDERSVPIASVRRNPANPRRSFDPDELDELATSLRAHGFLSPIVVRPAEEEGAYEIVAGERRWRAAQRAELTHVPVIVREVDDRLALELAIVENVQRSDLNAIEEARGYEQLTERGYSSSDLAEVIGKSRSHVANTMRLMQLPEDVRRLVVDGSISAGHARALITSPDPSALARRVVEDGLTVRQTERLARLVAKGEDETPRDRSKDPDTASLERRLADRLGLRVSVDHGRRGGKLVIRYGDADELAALCRRLDVESNPPNFD